MENESDVDTRSLEDIIRKQENSACKRRLRQMGYSKTESEMACAALLTLKRDDSVVGNMKKMGGGKTANISLRKVSSLIKAIKTKGTQKVGAMGINPMLVHLPQKSLHRLQTKLEKLFTAEEKFLTSEQRLQRAKYATTMKKQDAIEFTEKMAEEFRKDFEAVMIEMRELYPEMTDEEIEKELWGMKSGVIGDSAYFNDEIVIDTINSGLNNIIKAPIILAKELVQEYIFREEDGSTRKEHHFKPYDELAKSINGLDQIPMIIEHQESWEEEAEVGYIKQFVADAKLRAIRGMAYFYENRLPQVLLDAIKSGLPIAVSIGFMAELGGSGIWEGLLYDHTQENIQLQHLAILLDSLPRCSIDHCGVNLGDEKDTVKDQKFTLINKGNYYYNINSLIDIEETRKEKANTDKKIKSDNMTEDSFPDPKSGTIAGDEPHYFEVMLKRMRKYIHGESEFIDPNFAKKKIQEIIQHLTDEEEETETLQGEDNMEQKEFEDAITKKDEEIETLKEIVKDSLIKEIRSFTDAKTQEKLKLEDKCVKELKIIRDTVTVLEPITEEPDVLPIESKEEKLEEMKDAGVTPSKDSKKYKVRDEGDYFISDMFADINEEFEEGSFILSA